MVSEVIKVRNKTGLHLRPATELVKICEPMKSKVTLIKGAKRINPKSVIMLMGGGIKCGDEITVEVDGENEAEDLQKILDAINGGFGEEMID